MGTSFTYKTLEKLTLRATAAATKELGLSLPEMSSLEELVLSCEYGSILQAEQMEALFGRFNKTLPLLKQLTFSGFSVRGCLAPLIKCLRFFPNLRELRLEELNIDEHDQCSLLKSFGSLTRLEVDINGERLLSSLHWCPDKGVKRVKLGVTSLTPAVAVMLGGLLPELSSLQELKLTGLRGSILQAEQTEVLFGRFNKTVSLLKQLTFSGFNVRGCLAPLIKSLRFFPNLRELRLEKLNIDEHEQCSLLKSFGSLTSLGVGINGEWRQDSFLCRLHLVRLLLKWLSLQEQLLELTDPRGSILQAEQMEALFGRFNKTLPLLKQLTFSGFSVRGCLAPLIKCLRFFPNLRELRLEELNIDEHDQCSLLKSFGSLTRLEVDINGERLLSSLHWCPDKGVKRVKLGVTSLTPAVAVMLGGLLPELSSLQELKLTGLRGSILQAEQTEVLFGRFNKTVSLLKQLTFSGFNVRGCLAPLIKSLRFFPNLRELRLEKLNIDEHEQCSLLKSFGSLTSLGVGINGEWRQDSFLCRLHLVRLLLKWLSLQEQLLELTDPRGSILQAEEMKALFDGFIKTLPLRRLAVCNFSARGCLFPLFMRFRFPNLVWLELHSLNLDEHDLHGLMESFQFIPNLKLLSLANNPLGHAITFIVPHVTNLKKLQYLLICDNGHSEKDFNYVRDIVREALPDLKIVTDSRPVCINVLDLVREMLR